MEHINIEGLKINFEKKGQGKNKIIFLHGNSCSLNYFNNQFNNEKLLDAFELIRFDFPGHGLSDYAKNLGTYSVTGFAHILTGLYKQLNIKDSVLVGTSFGGNIALDVLSELQDVKGVVLAGSSPFGPPTVAEMYLPHPALPLFFKGKLTHDDINTISKLVFNDLQHISLLKQSIKQSDPKFREVLLPNSEKVVPKNQIEIVKNSNTPVAVIYGKDDEIINPEYLKNVPFKNLWQNKVIVIPEAKHFPNIEKSETFNQYLFDFCSQQFNSSK